MVPCKLSVRHQRVFLSGRLSLLEIAIVAVSEAADRWIMPSGKFTCQQACVISSDDYIVECSVVTVILRILAGHDNKNK